MNVYIKLLCLKSLLTGNFRLRSKVNYKDFMESDKVDRKNNFIRYIWHIIIDKDNIIFETSY